MAYPHQPEHITLVMTDSVLAGKQPDYEHWLEKIMPEAALFGGHLGVNVLRPQHGEMTYTILIRFDSVDNLYRWIQSQQRQSSVPVSDDNAFWAHWVVPVLHSNLPAQRPVSGLAVSTV